MGKPDNELRADIFGLVVDLRRGKHASESASDVTDRVLAAFAKWKRRTAPPAVPPPALDFARRMDPDSIAAGGTPSPVRRESGDFSQLAQSWPPETTSRPTLNDGVTPADEVTTTAPPAVPGEPTKRVDLRDPRKGWACTHGRPTRWYAAHETVTCQHCCEDIDQWWAANPQSLPPEPADPTGAEPGTTEEP